ncbi:hypothetical protein OUZ56_017445 [Daphnia magna]|uniref:Uncharacterized protein n=1 Tax=Daphnia magna TaxID=35525 RepID=A0ABR0AT96_9CRUS|nr:hypothetical protein OUZ56_017445 [Daphnia magna]
MVSIEFEKTFELYEIFVLPVHDAEGGIGLRHSSLPQFLAVAGDQQTFIELSEEEEISCKDNSGLVRPLARAIERKNAKKTCSIALFLQDTEKQKHECEQDFVKLKGPEALYLGQRQWALSMGKTQTLVITCPARAGSRKEEKQQHGRERIEVRRRLEVLEKTGSVEGAGDGEQAAQRSTQLDKLEIRIIEHEQHCMETLRSLEQLTK